MSLYEDICSRMRNPPWGRFQVHGVRHLMNCNGRGIIGDDMGLGKSYQTIAYLALRPDQRPALVVCPATLKYNWQQEFRNHAGIDAVVLESTTPKAPDGDVWIINYDILHYWAPILMGRVKTFVADEFQRIKNPKAKRTKASQKIAYVANHVIGLSGTPIQNGPVEFFPILNMVAPKEFPSFLEYAFRYCAPRKGFRNHWDFSGSSNLGELHDRISPFMIRRMKTEVLTDLPGKTPTFIPLKIPMKEYRKAREDFIAWLTQSQGAAAASRARGAEALVRLGALKRLAAREKLPAIIEWMRDWRDDRPNEKLVVFAIHKAIINELIDHFPGAAVVTGSVTGVRRQEAVDRFQNTTTSECPFFFGNLAAAGEGLTLTAAAATATIELDWVPGRHDQAEDRVLRIGQRAAHVDAFYFIARNTIEEEYLLPLLDEKRAVVGRVLDGEEGEQQARNLQARIIEDLITNAAYERKE